MNESDDLEVIALGPLPSSRPRRRTPAVLAMAALAVVVLGGGALAFVANEHPAPHKAATPAPPVSPAFDATALGISNGRFAIVNDGHLEFVNAANGATDSVPGNIAGDVAIAATSGASVIAVIMRHWYLVEPGHPPLPLPDGNVFSRHAGGWWVAQGDHVSVLGSAGPAIQLPRGTTVVADTSAGFVLQNTANSHVMLWNPADRQPPRSLVAANAEILAVGGNKVVWRPANNGTASVRVVDVVTDHSITIAHPDLTSGVDVSVAPDGKHIAFYNRDGGGMVSLFDIENDAVLFAFDSRTLGTFSPFNAVPGPTGYQPLPFTWTPDGRKIIVLGTLYPVPRITAMDTQDGIAITTSTTFGLDQLAALGAPSTS
jgi:hypothetical protein